MSLQSFPFSLAMMYAADMDSHDSLYYYDVIGIPSLSFLSVGVRVLSGRGTKRSASRDRRCLRCSLAGNGRNE